MKRLGHTPEEFHAMGWRSVELNKPKQCELWIDGAWWPVLLHQWRCDPQGQWQGYVTCYEAPSGATSPHWQASRLLRKNPSDRLPK